MKTIFEDPYIFAMMIIAIIVMICAFPDAPNPQENLLRDGTSYYGTTFGTDEMRVKFLGMIYEDIPCRGQPEHCYWTPVQWIGVSTPASTPPPP